MRAYVGDLLAEPGATRTVAFCDRVQPPSDEVALPDPVRGELALSGANGVVRVRGRVTTAVELTCGACLTRFAAPLDVEIDEEFARAPGDRAGSGEVALGPGDFVAPIEPGDVVDLTEVVRQHLVLALPIAPRCSPACRGLCPTCGADRNEGPCGCETDQVDPRFHVLRTWAEAADRRTGGAGGRRKGE